MSKDVEQKVQELEARYKLIADNLIDAIWVLDLEREQYDFITASIEKLSGFSADESKRQTLNQRMSASSYEKVKELIAEEIVLFEKGLDRKRSLELEMFHKEGHTYWLEITAKLFRDESGRLKIAGVSKDISKRKSAEAQREDLIKELGKALAEKEELLKEVTLLRGLLPICAGCKRIRDGNGKWWPLDAYVDKHSDSRLSHTICPDCSEVLYQIKQRPKE